jgi:amphi-Trp domain-containing protein
MSKEEIELDFEFSHDELANFLDSFAEKIREGEVGLSFKGKEEVEIEPDEDNRLELEFYESNEFKKMDLEIELTEEKETTEQGREKIEVEIK